MFDKHGVPNLITADSLLTWDVHAENEIGKWVLARGLGWQGLCFRRRLKLAWGVFTGKYDALRWNG